MYKIEYLSLAKKDMESIIYYISHELKNHNAALNLIDEFKKQEEYILTFPYGSSIYHSVGPLKHEYRCAHAKNFSMFYVINEKQKTITIARVLYQKRDIKKLL